MEAVVLETAIAASKALALSLHMVFLAVGFVLCCTLEVLFLLGLGVTFVLCLFCFHEIGLFSYQIGSLSDGSSVLPEASGTSPGFPLTELLPKKKSDPDNQDGMWEFGLIGSVGWEDSGCRICIMVRKIGADSLGSGAPAAAVATKA
ncbi:hypothetical protein SADUNF_Sadunf18G0018600 [Salix dunnii]|uniref:Uncharacterized protein n=1 Tax=Salix dunnii TaxID=1413687 RepID=A0A835MFX5_9ROSI|nr:hypothetical protein SADUNF_Sadunf18G0018600 [Salix dunnii]